MNQMEIPLIAGYRPYANPYFKIFVYGGRVSTFNIRGFVELDDNRKALQVQAEGYPWIPARALPRRGAHRRPVRPRSAELRLSTTPSA